MSNDNAERFAEIISGTRSRANTSHDWLQLRSWCHGAALMSYDTYTRDQLYLLRDISAINEREAAKGNNRDCSSS